MYSCNRLKKELPTFRRHWRIRYQVNASCDDRREIRSFNSVRSRAPSPAGQAWPGTAGGEPGASAFSASVPASAGAPAFSGGTSSTMAPTSMPVKLTRSPSASIVFNRREKSCTADMM